MISVVATLRAKDGSAEEMAGLFRDIQAAVRANEPGNVVYEMFRSRTEPNMFKVIEIYRDQAALEAHRQNEAVKVLAPRLGDLKAAPTEAEYFDGID